MKISKYINKYDFVDYYTKQPEMWFFTNSEIQAGIDLVLKNLGSSKESIEEDEDSNKEYDSYEYFSQLKLENASIDEDNPLIIEGNIIDNLSKKEIIKLFKIDVIVDFDDDEYKYTKMEDFALKTKDLLCSNENIIIFQPVFIFENLITKPDALIKKCKKIKIIETKGTTTSKLNHLLDLLFQKKVIEKQDFLKNYLFEYNLCLVSYNKMNKNKIGFVIAKNCNISKSSPQLSSKMKKKDDISNDKKIELKQMLKIGEWFQGENYDNIFPITITEILNNDWNTFEQRYDNNTNPQTRSSMDNFKKEFLDVLNNFDSTIEKLWSHKISMSEKDFPKNFKPSKEDKGFFKNCSYWDQLKFIYGKMGYSLFLYSGHVVNQTSENIEKYKIQDDLDKYMREGKGPGYVFKYLTNEKDIFINEVGTFNTFQKLKKNKIYFDFESINTAIRNVDNSLPFNQIVTQCSIIKWFEDENIKDLTCQNLIIDPKEINTNWFKEIIDKIYCSKDGVSYVVYNKAFEETRIKEMAIFINEKNYYIKSNNIISNLFDLADFFDPRKNLITIKEIFGYYSIKKVLALIEKNDSNLFDITKSKNYKSLEISNGLDCQQKTVLRFFDKLNDDEWKEMSKKLTEYCENDVRAMIAVELYIKKIIKNEK